MSDSVRRTGHNLSDPAYGPTRKSPYRYKRVGPIYKSHTEPQHDAITAMLDDLACVEGLEKFDWASIVNDAHAA